LRPNAAARLACGIFASADHPWVFFLDDLQWADPASLRLLHLVLTKTGSSHLLLIGAYRDNQVGPLHPLALALAELRKARARVSKRDPVAARGDGGGGKARNAHRHIAPKAGASVSGRRGALNIPSRNQRDVDLPKLLLTAESNMLSAPGTIEYVRNHFSTGLNPPSRAGRV
jgi:hypothetical protein